MSASVRLLLAASLHICTLALQSRPNILFVLVDDLGWNDVSYHNHQSADFETPFLDEIAQDALTLNHYYVQHFCTPTRHALMSGRYPMRDGMQQWVIRSSSGYGMPLDITTLPENLLSAGYSTHLLGKWHLGFFDPDYTPTNRGFESFFGYYGDKEEYFMKNNSEWAVFQNLPPDQSLQRISGFDFRDGTTPWVTEEYSTYFYGNQTIDQMMKHVEEEDADPFFILLSSQAPHTPYDAPQHILDEYSEKIEDEDRSQLAAVLSVFDQSMGDIVDYMKSEESGYIWEDTLVIVSSDNGGSVTEGASNFPLRGGKKTLWEGGIRATAFVTGGWLPDARRGQEMNALMHVTDWLPTLCTFAGVDPAGDLELDGYDQSTNIMIGEMDMYHPREELLHHVILHEDSETDGTSSSCYEDFCGAIRWRDYKLVRGTDSTMKWNDDEDSNCVNTWCENAVPQDPTTASHTLTCAEGQDNYQYPALSSDSCLFSGTACLFDVVNDPCEWTDIRESNMDIFEMLVKKLYAYNLTQSYPMFREYPENATLANPNQFGNFWSPWENNGLSQDENGDEDQDEITMDGPELPNMEGPDRERGQRPERGFPENERPDQGFTQRDRPGHLLVKDPVKMHTKAAMFTMNAQMMVFVVLLFAGAVVLQLYHCWKSRKGDYKRIGGDNEVDTIRISA